MKDVLKDAVTLSKEETEVSYPEHLKIITVNGEPAITALGKMINGEFAFAFLNEIREAAAKMAAENGGCYQVTCIEVADEGLPNFLETLNGQVYVNSDCMEEPDPIFQEMLNTPKAEPEYEPELKLMEDDVDYVPPIYWIKDKTKELNYAVNGYYLTINGIGVVDRRELLLVESHKCDSRSEGVFEQTRHKKLRTLTFDLYEFPDECSLFITHTPRSKRLPRKLKKKLGTEKYWSEWRRVWGATPGDIKMYNSPSYIAITDREAREEWDAVNKMLGGWD